MFYVVTRTGKSKAYPTRKGNVRYNRYFRGYTQISRLEFIAYFHEAIVLKNADLAPQDICRGG